MIIDLKGHLMWYAHGQKTFEVNEDSLTIKDLLIKLEIPDKEVGIIQVNGKIALFHTQVYKADHVVLYPQISAG